MNYYFVHPLRDNNRDLSTYTYITYGGHDNSFSPNKVDISSTGSYSTDGNKVVSMTSGTVISAGTFSSGIGYVVIAAEPDAEPVTKIRYLHLDNRNLAVSTGDTVVKGQLIGYVAPYDEQGRYGFGEGDGAHLHVDFGSNPNDRTVDFEDFPPISKNKLPDNLDYDTTIYQNLCSQRGVSSDISDTYFWPYMLWSQRPVSGSAEILNGQTVDCSSIISQQAPVSDMYYTNYNDWTWAYNQRKVYDLWNAQDSSEKWSRGAATLNGRYLVAVATKDCGGAFGYVGDKIDIVLTNNVIINAIIADAKAVSTDPKGIPPWGHDSDTGLSLVEFEVDKNNPHSPDPAWGDAKVSKIIIGESIIK